MVNQIDGSGRADVPSTPAAPATPGASPPTPFADVLRTVADPFAGIAQVRSAIASIRDGSGWAAPPGGPPRSGAPADPEPGKPAAGASSARSATAAGSAVSSRATTPAASKTQAVRVNGGADPQGWRAMTRAYGDSIVGPGFGALFERQIDQESGYDPAVVFGQRRSSAGAEGIAQLMPQYYGHVDRTDPDASLRAGAQTMRENLAAVGGDVRKAMAAYNAGLGTVQQLVRAYGDRWESGLPHETQQYLAAILGSEAPRVYPNAAGHVVTALPRMAAVQRPESSALSLLLDAEAE